MVAYPQITHPMAQNSSKEASNEPRDSLLSTFQVVSAWLLTGDSSGVDSDGLMASLCHCDASPDFLQFGTCQSVAFQGSRMIRKVDIFLPPPIGGSPSHSETETTSPSPRRGAEQDRDHTLSKVGGGGGGAAAISYPRTR